MTRTIAVAVVLMLAAGATSAAEPAKRRSCFDRARTDEAFYECAQKEILPLETRLVHRVNALRSQYASDAERVKSLEASQDAWNGYRNRHCTLEAEALGKGDRDRSRRAFSRCTLRVVKARLAELAPL